MDALLRPTTAPCAREQRSALPQRSRAARPVAVMRRSGMLRRTMPFTSSCDAAADAEAELSAEKEEAVLGERPELLFAGLSAVQGARDGMEDEVAVKHDGPLGYTLLGVFDGHGGTAACEWLQANLFDILEANIVARPDVDKDADAFVQLLQDSFSEADQKLIADLTSREVPETAGSTATIGLVRRDKVVIANVGDSRAVLCRKGQAIDLSAEHRVYGVGEKAQEEIARVEATGGWVDDGRVCSVLAVSRSFGDYEFKGDGLPLMKEHGVEKEFYTQEFADSHEITSDPVIVMPDVVEMPLGDDDEFCLVATDGLWDVMTSLEAARFVRQKLKKGEDTQSIADALTDIAIKRYSTDNIGVVIIDLLGPEGWKPAKKKTDGKKKKKLFGLF